MNAAIAAATGDVIVRVDGHCEVPPDFVRRAVLHLSRDAVDCVGGILDTIGETRTARVIAAAMSAPFGVGGSAFRSADATSPHARAYSMLTDTVAFPAFTREAIARAGWFDEELVRNQDDEYSYRLRRLGGRILLAADMRARYYSRGTLRGLWRQCFEYRLLESSRAAEASAADARASVRAGGVRRRPRRERGPPSRSRPGCGRCPRSSSRLYIAAAAAASSCARRTGMAGGVAFRSGDSSRFSPCASRRCTWRMEWDR